MAVQGYDNIRIGPKNTEGKRKLLTTRTYRGFSTVTDFAQGYSLYDLNLIKQDLINHFHIRKGEKLENPEFGTIIWDLLFEPLTPQLREVMVNDVSNIVNNDPRTKADKIIVTQVEQGIQIEITMTYLPYNIQETMQFNFDQRNGIF
jgi:hypothetical protein